MSLAYLYGPFLQKKDMYSLIFFVKLDALNTLENNEYEVIDEAGTQPDRQVKLLSLMCQQQLFSWNVFQLDIENVSQWKLGYYLRTYTCHDLTMFEYPCQQDLVYSIYLLLVVVHSTSSQQKIIS